MDAERSPARRALAVAGHLAIAVGVTWPMVLHLGRLPLGHEPVGTVPRFNLWTLRWTADRIPHGLSHWWDAPIFWPHRGTFAFSEPQPLTGAAYAVVRLVAGDVGGYSLVLVLTIALNGVAAAALARRLGAGGVAAFATGVLAQALPFVFDQFGVLQLVVLWPIFAALASLVAWLDDPRPRHAVLFGLAVAASILTCGYYAVLFGLAALVAVPVGVDGSWRNQWRERTAGVMVAGGTALLLAAPVIVGQQARVGGRSWRAETISAGSARWDQWLPGGRLWPGLPLLLVAGSGLWLSRRRRPTWVLVVLGLAAVLISLGSHLSIAGLHPWSYLADHLSPIAHLRSPFRAAAIVQVVLVALAAPALQRLWDGPSPVLRSLVPVLVATSVITSGVGPGRLVEPPSQPGVWADRLERRDDGAAVVFLPFAPGTSAADFEETTGRMLQALDVGHPLLNGYSGFFPADHDADRDALRGFPDDRSLVLLQERAVRYVVIRAGSFDAFDRRIARSLGYRVLGHDDDGWLLEVPPDGTSRGG